MQGAAHLSALKGKCAELGGLEPDACVAAGENVFLDAKCRNKKIVNDVFGGHREFNRDMEWHMKLIDFARAVRVLQLPHPLLADDEDFSGIRGRTGIAEEEAAGPEKNEGTDGGGNKRPGEFQRDGGFDFLGNLVVGAAAVLDHEVEDDGENAEGEKERESGQEVIQIVDPMGDSRGRWRMEREKQPSRRKGFTEMEEMDHARLLGRE